LPAPAHEPQELAAVHPRHPAGHVSAAAAHLQQVRGPDAGPAQQRALLRLHQQPHA